jgi:hypothetical protein
VSEVQNNEEVLNLPAGAPPDAFRFDPAPSLFFGFFPEPTTTAAPGSSSQSGQNHSPSGTASSGGSRQARWYGLSHCQHIPGQSSHRDKTRASTNAAIHTHLFALKERIVLPSVLVANDAQLWRLHINRVTREVRELIIGLGEEKGRVLARRDSVKGEQFQMSARLVCYRGGLIGFNALEDFDTHKRLVSCGLCRAFRLVRA